MSSHPEFASRVIFQMPTTYASIDTKSDFDVSVRSGYTKVDDAAGNMLADFGSPPPPPPSLTTFSHPTANTLDTVPAGTWTGHQDVASECVNYTLQGAGRDKTILDGQGGIGSGHRLSWGKGVVHTRATNTIVENIGFVNGGGADGVSDGEAGFYVGDGQTGLATVRDCDFSACENGIYAQSGSGDLLIQTTSFGTRGGNGLNDGRSHDLYVSGRTVTILGAVFVGNSRGNTIKSRSPLVKVSKCWVGRNNGRWLDIPGGSEVDSTENIYVTVGAVTRNAMGFDDELDDAVSPGRAGSFLSTDDTFYFQRSEEAIWINHVATRVEFVRPRVFWIGADASAPRPSVTIQGPGALVNTVSPFVFDETNRVGAVPTAPTLA